MNRKCYGDVFEFCGKRWMRCLADSTVTQVEAEPPATCAACGRPFVPSGGIDDVPASVLDRVELSERRKGWTP